MKDELEREQPLVDYLLGKLSPEAEHRFAEQYFVDDTLFDRLQHVENELLDLYAHGRLDSEERTSFEHYLAMHPEGKHKVALATALKQLSASERVNSESVLEREAPLSWWGSLSTTLENQNRAIRWALAASLTVILLSVGYMVYQRRQMLEARDDISELRATDEALRRKIAEQEAEIAGSKTTQQREQETPQPEQAQTSQPSQSPQEPKTQHAVAYLLFNLPVRGSVGTETLQLVPDTKSVSVTIILEQSESHSRYRARVQSSSGATVIPPRDISAKIVGSRRILTLTINKPILLTESKYYLYVAALNEGQEVLGATRILPFKVVR